VTHLDRLVGTWVTEASHPALPGVVVHGEAVLEWLEGEQFLVVRARTDHPEFPDSISVIGVMDTDRVGEEANDDSPLSMHYFDSRGVFRVYQVHVDDGAWRLWRDAAACSPTAGTPSSAVGNSAGTTSSGTRTSRSPIGDLDSVIR
jgi:hypothetical protein